MEVTSHTEQGKRNEKCWLIGRLLLLYIMENLIFSSSKGLTTSTTSLLPKDNLGLSGLTISNATEVIVEFFIVPWFTRLFGVKKVLMFGVFTFILYPLSYFYPVSYIFICGCIMRGLGISLITSGIYIYGSKLIYQYHEAMGGNLTVLLVVMSGINQGAIGGGYLFGGILEYTIFNTKHIINSTETEKNICGPNYCNEDLSNLTAVQLLSRDKYYTLIGVFTGLIFIALVLCLFLVDFPSESKVDTPIKEFTNMVKITFKQLLDPRGYLLIIITIFLGSVDVFFSSVFTYAFINCTLGIHNIGKTIMAYGSAKILMCFCNWIPVKIIKRMPTLAIGCLIYIGCFVTMLVYPFSTTTTNDLNTVYFVITSAYAVATAITSTTTFSMYALMFPENVGASYGLAYFWVTAGAMIGNAITRFICVSTELYLIISLVILSFLLYSYLEYLLHKGKISSNNVKDN